MEVFMDGAFPAGDESDTSDDEWDLGHSLAKQPPRTEDVDAAAPRADGSVSVLRNAIFTGDTETLEKLLDDGLDVDTRLGFGWTPLMRAVNVANYDLAKVLLDRGASVNFSKDQRTVLMASCKASASEDEISRCMELLLSRNADPNVADRTQMTCLMMAAREGYSKVINLLLSHGADINVQDGNGYTALSIAAQYGREEAVLKLLQLGADKTIRNNSGKGPADLAVIFKHAQVTRILSSPSHVSTSPTESQFLLASVNPPSSEEKVAKLDEIGIFLHGLDLGFLTKIMTENGITWGYLLTMEKEDLEKIGITDPEDQQKVLSALEKMDLDKLDLGPIDRLGAKDSGSEELHTFLISVHLQCCYLTEALQDVINHFPRQASQLVFALDPKKEAQAMCNRLVVQTNDLQKEVTCLHSLLCQMNEGEDSCPQLPQPAPHGNWKLKFLTRVTLSTLGATLLVFLYKAARG